MTSFVYVDPPVPLPRKYGLFSVAEVQDITDTHMLMGVQYETINCFGASDAVLATWCDSPDLVSNPFGNQVVEDETVLVSSVAIQCAGISDFRNAQNKATKVLAAGEERALERAIAIHFRDDIGVDDTPTSAISPPNAVGYLEEEVDGDYSGAPVLWGSRRMGELLVANHVLSQHGNQLQSGMGSPYIASGYYGAMGPEAAAAGTGNEWLWASARPLLRRGAMSVSETMFKMTTGGSVEVQTLTITGTPTGGNYTLTFDGQTTGNIAYNAVAATIQTALEALSNLAPGDVVVTGTAPNFTITFGGTYPAGSNPAQITATPALTGGTSPGITMATTVTGETGETDNTFIVLAQRMWVLSLDCLTPIATKTTLTHP